MYKIFFGFIFNKSFSLFECILLIFLTSLGTELKLLLIEPPKKPEKPETPEIIYKYKDTIRFYNTKNKTVEQTISDVEFRVLGKNSLMYAVRIETETNKNDFQEVLVANDIPPDCVVEIEKR